MVCASNASTSEEVQTDTSEFKLSVVHRASSRTVKTIQRDPISKNQQEKKGGRERRRERGRKEEMKYQGSRILAILLTSKFLSSRILKWVRYQMRNLNFYL